MSDETITLAKFAVGLDFDDIPDAVKQRAKDSIADTIATMAFGANFP